MNLLNYIRFKMESELQELKDQLNELQKLISKSDIYKTKEENEKKLEIIDKVLQNTEEPEFKSEPKLESVDRLLKEIGSEKDKDKVDTKNDSEETIFISNIESDNIEIFFEEDKHKKEKVTEGDIDDVVQVFSFFSDLKNDKDWIVAEHPDGGYNAIYKTDPGFKEAIKDPKFYEPKIDPINVLEELGCVEHKKIDNRPPLTSKITHQYTPGTGGDRDIRSSPSLGGPTLSKITQQQYMPSSGNSGSSIGFSDIGGCELPPIGIEHNGIYSPGEYKKLNKPTICSDCVLTTYYLVLVLLFIFALFGLTIYEKGLKKVDIWIIIPLAILFYSINGTNFRNNYSFSKMIGNMVGNLRIV